MQSPPGSLHCADGVDAAWSKARRAFDAGNLRALARAPWGRSWRQWKLGRHVHELPEGREKQRDILPSIGVAHQADAPDSVLERAKSGGYLDIVLAQQLLADEMCDLRPVALPPSSRKAAGRTVG